MARVTTSRLFSYWSPNNTGGIQMGLTLDDYADLLGWDVNGFNGVNRSDMREDAECNRIWLQSSRNRLAYAIVRAEIMREQEIGYFIGEKYVIDEFNGPENPVILQKKHLIALGIPTLATIQDGYVLDLGAETAPNDPVTISIASTVVVDEVVVYYPGEEVPITPTAITSDGATLTITIPRARLVIPDFNDDRADPIDYYENDWFLKTVDVKRLYLDEDEALQYVWRRPWDTCPTNCLPLYQTACWQFSSPRAYRLATIRARPATYSAGAFTTADWSYTPAPDQIKVTYKSGSEDYNSLFLTARMAHTLLPYSPCDCQVVNVTWLEDQKIVPGVWTSYGNKQGQVNAWNRDSRNKIGNAGKFPRAT